MNEDRFLPARAIWQRYDIVDMTLWRWLRDPRMNFPKPLRFGRFRRWKLADLLEWEERQAVRTRASANETSEAEAS
jgi:predicted DNA-binding transcriptional regulator AlpA